MIIKFIFVIITILFNSSAFAVNAGGDVDLIGKPTSTYSSSACKVSGATAATLDALYTQALSDCGGFVSLFNGNAAFAAIITGRDRLGCTDGSGSCWIESQGIVYTYKNPVACPTGSLFSMNTLNMPICKCDTAAGYAFDIINGTCKKSTPPIPTSAVPSVTSCPSGFHLVTIKIVNTKSEQCISNSLICPSGFNAISGSISGVPSTECYSSNASSVPAASSVSPTSCPAGQSAASGNIANLDGTSTYHVRCYDKSGTLMSDNGVNTPAGQAAADAAAAAAAAAAVAAAAKAAADSAASSTPSASSVSATPNNYAASGIFYTPGKITGGKTLLDVVKNFLAQVKQTDIMKYLSNFFNLSGLSGHNCPIWSLSIPFPTGAMLDMHIDFLCWDITTTTLNTLGLLMLFFAAFQSYKIAFK